MADDDNVPQWWKDRLRGTDCIINDECWEAYELFDFCGTQWRTSATGGRTGLDYTAVCAVATSWGCADRQTLDYVRHLEIGALTKYNGKTLEFLFDGGD